MTSSAPSHFVCHYFSLELDNDQVQELVVYNDPVDLAQAAEGGLDSRCKFDVPAQVSDRHIVGSYWRLIGPSALVNPQGHSQVHNLACNVLLGFVLLQLEPADSNHEDKSSWQVP